MEMATLHNTGKVSLNMHWHACVDQLMFVQPHIILDFVGFTNI
jgi:hypothetical protein